MSDDPKLDWLYMRVALVVVALVGVADVLAWKAHDIIYPQPTRLERATLCLTNNHGTVAVVPAADPLARSAGEGSLQATIEGNDVTVALASSEEQARKIERDYNTVASGLEGRLERRNRTVYLWRFRASPTQRQAMYDCLY